MLPATEETHVVYRLRLVPRVWDLTRTIRSRVFQNLSTIGIVEQVLMEGGFARNRDYEIQLVEDYSKPEFKREYTVQYEESDFDFISRLLEHEGLFFCFRQTDDCEVMVIADANSAFEYLAGFQAIAFSPLDSPSGLREGIWSIDWAAETVPEQVWIREYNWRSPGLLVQAKSPVGRIRRLHQDDHSPYAAGMRELDRFSFGVGQVYHYGENLRSEDASPDGKVLGPEEKSAKRIARIRAEELSSSRVVFRGQCRVPGLRAGHKFHLPDHFYGEAITGEFVVVGLEHNFHRPQDGGETGFDSRFTIVPYNLPFRPARKTPRPRITNLITGFIDGGQGEAGAPLDQHGRYKVVLPFDAGAEPGGYASRWIRMAQLTAGLNAGVHLPLHVGTEVIIAHLNGDPDRPVIVGAVANALTPSPVTRKNATQSVIRTHGEIQIEMEDDAPDAPPSA